MMRSCIVLKIFINCGIFVVASLNSTSLRGGGSGGDEPLPEVWNGPPINLNQSMIEDRHQLGVQEIVRTAAVPYSPVYFLPTQSFSGTTYITGSVTSAISSYLTIAGWVTTSKSGAVIMSMGRSSSSINGEFMFGIYNDGKPYYFEWDGSYGILINGTTRVASGTAAHVAFVKSGAEGWFYVNGVFEAYKYSSKWVSITNKWLTLGYDQRDNARYFKGSMDDLSLYNTALSSSYIQSLYNYFVLNPTVLYEAVATKTFNGYSTYYFQASFTETPGYYLTMTMWILTSNGNSYIATISRSPTAVDGEGVLMVTSAGKLRFWEYNYGYGIDLTGNAYIANGKWNHVAVVKRCNKGYLYVNGQLDASQTAANSMQILNNGFNLGSDYRDKICYFSGSMMKIYVYNYPLSSSAIYSSYLDGPPTYAPTESPSRYPTRLPTLPPSQYPTARPSTNVPSCVPTYIPSTIPTVNPSKQPTWMPTFFPSVYPTRSPTVWPSVMPTPPPTYFPTTMTPSQVPTTYPSLFPTIPAPTVTPTTPFPTCEPTCNPTQLPSKSPTCIPTKVPTLVPSKYPTYAPTLIPTYQPSTSPTLAPTVFPTTANPSFVPTIVPTLMPTVPLPTVAPTTAKPSVTPTMIPTGAPSFDPTHRPTPIPTLLPTLLPSLEPTYIPTLVPTKVPTIAPTDIPTQIPTIVPSASPTYGPTVASTTPLLVYKLHDAVLDGSNPIIEESLPHAPVGNLTIGMWINTTSCAAALVSMCPQSGSDDGVRIMGINAKGSLYYAERNGVNAGGLHLISATNVATGYNIHVAIVKHKNTGWLYINGQVDAINVTTVPSTIISRDFYLGGDCSAHENGLTGWVGDVNVFNYALSEDSIFSLYSIRAPTQLPTTAPSSGGPPYSSILHLTTGNYVGIGFVCLLFIGFSIPYLMDKRSSMCNYITIVLAYGDFITDILFIVMLWREMNWMYAVSEAKGLHDIPNPAYVSNPCTADCSGMRKWYDASYSAIIGSIICLIVSGLVNIGLMIFCKAINIVFWKEEMKKGFENMMRLLAAMMKVRANSYHTSPNKIQPHPLTGASKSRLDVQQNAMGNRAETEASPIDHPGIGSTSTSAQLPSDIADIFNTFPIQTYYAVWGSNGGWHYLWLLKMLHWLIAITANFLYQTYPFFFGGFVNIMLLLCSISTSELAAHYYGPPIEEAYVKDTIVHDIIKPAFEIIFCVPRDISYHELFKVVLIPLIGVIVEDIPQLIIQIEYAKNTTGISNLQAVNFAFTIYQLIGTLAKVYETVQKSPTEKEKLCCLDNIIQNVVSNCTNICKYRNNDTANQTATTIKPASCGGKTYTAVKVGDVDHENVIVEPDNIIVYTDQEETI